MLREIKNTKQHKGEELRRWFNCNTMDLMIWFDEHQNIIEFQIYYDKPNQEHALNWKTEVGFQHSKVDDGESNTGKHKGTPILVPNGTFTMSSIIDKFNDNAEEISDDIREFINTQLEAVESNN